MCGAGDYLAENLLSDAHFRTSGLIWLHCSDLDWSASSSSDLSRSNQIYCNQIWSVLIWTDLNWAELRQSDAQSEAQVRLNRYIVVHSSDDRVICSTDINTKRYIIISTNHQCIRISTNHKCINVPFWAKTALLPSLHGAPHKPNHDMTHHLQPAVQSSLYPACYKRHKTPRQHLCLQVSAAAAAAGGLSGIVLPL